MNTSKERAAALRARLSKAKLPTPPQASGELGRASIHAMLAEAGLKPREVDPRLDVRLHGRAIGGHEVPVRQATSILGSLQDVVSACGQAVARKITAAGSMPGAILRATELRMSPALGFGSVVFHLGGASEVVTGDEFPGTTGTETLLDRVFGELFAVLDFVAKNQIPDSVTVEHLRKLGPRFAKHLNELAKEVMDSEIDIDLAWRSSSSSADSTLKRPGALALKDAIERNREEVSSEYFQGVLSTVSMLVRPQLVMFDGRRIDMAVDVQVAANLGMYYNRQVAVEVEQRRLWSIATERETLSYKLLHIELAEPELGP
ncbi:hypothetical protein ACIO1C_16350 [Streptomyces sp. NPDC087420]|uniref:hypothetical protein n=1 Tax=Streptomyces sp. NPDC087420 TaxID=3365785 RepID=UPI00383559EF